MKSLLQDQRDDQNHCGCCQGNNGQAAADEGKHKGSCGTGNSSQYAAGGLEDGGEGHSAQNRVWNIMQKAAYEP